MALTAKPYTVKWPLTARSAEDIDKMFRDLYRELAAVESASGSSATTKTGLTFAQVSARVLHEL